MSFNNNAEKESRQPVNGAHATMQPSGAQSSVSRGFRPRAGTLMLSLFIIGATFAGAACGRSEMKADAANERGGRGGGEARPDTPAIAVTTATAVAREVPTFVQATGSLVAQEISNVAPQSSGQIVATPVSVGAFVRQGDVLARLNDRDARLRLQQAQAAVRQSIAGVRQAEARLGLRPGGGFEASAIPEVRAAGANLEQAQANLQLAEANERRYRALVETGDVAVTVYEQFRNQRDTARAQMNAARQQMEAAINAARQSNQAILSAQADVESQRAAVAIAQKAVTDAIIRAPYSGYVSARPIAVGEYVTPASVVATILRTNPLKLQLQMPESEVPSIRPGMGVSLEVEAHRDRKFSGRVAAINPAIDPVSRAAIVEAEVENPDNSLRAGMFATARVSREGGGRAVFLPRSAVLADPNTNSFRAFVIDGDRARLRVLQIGTEEGDWIQILSGVNADEVVATSNLQQLYEGAFIRVE